MPIMESVNVDHVLNLLNEALEIDHDAMYALCLNRVSCNEVMAEHPTIQVNSYSQPGCSVGLLGILNGIFGTDDRGYGPISADFEEPKTCANGHLVAKKSTGRPCPECGVVVMPGRLKGFLRTKKEEK